MPVQIGQKADHTFADPLGLLSDCHRRIERFLGVLAALAASAVGRELDDGERRSLGAALAYFREAAPKHTSDEEESLFPRLRAAGGPEVEQVLAEVGRLESDHALAAGLHEEVDRIGAEWLRAGALAPELTEHLRSLTGRLSSLYRAHIEVEDNRLFPLARRTLSPAAQQEIGVEMAARRR